MPAWNLMNLQYILSQIQHFEEKHAMLPKII